MEKNLVIVLLSIVLIQWMLGFFQIMSFDKFLQELRRRYRDSKGYYLYVENIRKITGSVLVVLIIDDRSCVVEAYLYSGVFVLAKFKSISEIIGLCIFDEELFLKISGYRKSVCAVIEKIRDREENRRGELIC